MWNLNRSNTETRQIRRESDDSDEDNIPEEFPEQGKQEKAHLVRELINQFVGMGRDDRDTLCDIQHQSAFLSEVGLVWKGGHGMVEASDIADDYCIDLRESASLCYEPPAVQFDGCQEGSLLAQTESRC